MENNFNFDPLKDNLPLQEIFLNLSLSELKVARLVCRRWGDEGALNLRHRAGVLNIHVNPPQLTYNDRITNDNLEFKRWNSLEFGALGDFLAKNNLDHILHLSLLPSFPWRLSTSRTEDKHEQEVYPLIYQVYYLQKNELNFAASILDNYLPKVEPFIKELRLELMLKQSEDFQMLERILKALGQLEKCCLEIAVFNDKLLQEVKLTKYHKRSKVKTLSIRLIPASNITHTTTKEQSLPPPGPRRLLSLFPNISFLDLIGRRPPSLQLQCRHKPMTNKIIKLLRGAKKLDLKLDGIRVAPRTVLDFQAIIEFTRIKPLKFLYFNICWKKAKSGSIFKALDEITLRCAATLERFDLEWRPMDEEVCSKLILPRMENLKSLTYSSKFMGRFEPDKVDRAFENETLTECFGFRNLFVDSGRNFNLKFPALESLSLIFVGPGDGELWKEIFPPENKENCISSKIKTLVVTFAGECESEEIQRFPQSLFPNLKQFRHGKWRENENKLFVCHHEYDTEGRLTRKWSWLAAVIKYRGFDLGGYEVEASLLLPRFFKPPISTYGYTIKNSIRDFGDYFYTIREKFRLRLGDHGFWDTELDIERSDFHWSRSDLRSRKSNKPRKV